MSAFSGAVGLTGPRPVGSSQTKPSGSADAQASGTFDPKALSKWLNDSFVNAFSSHVQVSERIDETNEKTGHTTRLVELAKQLNAIRWATVLKRMG